MSQTPIGLAEVVRRLSRTDIESAYEWLAFDYQGFEANGAAPKDWLARFAWRVPPSGEQIKRLFNQVNTYFAERWLSENAGLPPAGVLVEGNRLLLFRQGKGTGYRTRNIEFGIRAHLDILDPWRRTRWLRGVPPQSLWEVVAAWAEAVDRAQPSEDMALLLAMTLIAIHPFADANGRLGRVVFHWLCQRWGLPPVWLEEDADGELLRTGQGIESTTYLMATWMASVMDGSNVVAPGDQGRGSSIPVERIRATILAHLKQVCAGSALDSLDFHALEQHLRDGGHITSTSPRFRSLRDVLL